ILVDVGGLEILEQSVHFLLQRQPAVLLHIGSLEGLRTGFWQLIGGQVALWPLFSKIKSFSHPLPKLVAIESAVTVLVGGLEARAEIRWHRAGLGADTCSTKGQSKSCGREDERSTSQAHRATSFS